MRPETVFITAAFAILLTAGCATPSPSGDASPVDDPAETSSELVYADQWEAREIFVGPWTKNIYAREFDYHGEFSVRDASGVEVEELVEKEGRGETASIYLPLIGDRHARFVVVEPTSTLPAYAPTAFVFIVPPSAGLPTDVLTFLQQNGGLIMVGLEPLDQQLHPDLVDVDLKSGDLPAIPAPGAAAIRERMKNGESFAVVISSNGCGNSVAFQKAASGLAAEMVEQGGIVDLPADRTKTPDNFAFAEELVPQIAYPTIVAIRDGKAVDWTIGNEPLLARQMLIRNGLLEVEAPPWVYDATAPPEHPNRRMRALSMKSDLSAHKLDGVDFSNGRYVGTSFAGSSLRDADFSMANLENANFAHADLTGADLSKARVPGVNWYGATCPDGRKADERGGDCLPELAYGDFSELAHRIEQSHSRFISEKYEYDGEIESRIIDGEEFFELEKQHGRASIFPEFYPVSHHPDAKMLLLDLESNPRAPEALVFIFTPETGLSEEARARFPDGFFTDLGVDQLSWTQNPAAPERPNIDYEVAIERGREVIASATADDIRARMKRGEDFVVVITASGCRAVPKLLAMFGAHPQREQLSETLVDLAAGSQKSEAFALAQELTDGRIVYPTMVFIRDGRVIARTLGAQSYPLVHNRLAHHLGEDHLEWVRKATLSTNPDRRLRQLRSVARSKGLDDRSFDGQNLSGAYLRGSTLTNSSFRDADLSGADMRETVLSYADLTGADLAGTQLEGVLWYRTICPDGKLSEEHGGACPAR